MVYKIGLRLKRAQMMKTWIFWRGDIAKLLYSLVRKQLEMRPLIKFYYMMGKTMKEEKY
jgi:hypothetical protein